MKNIKLMLLGIAIILVVIVFHIDIPPIDFQHITIHSIRLYQTILPFSTKTKKNKINLYKLM